ncbi:glycoside hydrolase family 61 protein [Hypoxylon rubiginosum]|uniref:Glycoside hydrolase family 61 protein n=1 Tax=Hypoxylon rubiginosum TaxID=110542 RepID=A0ACB9YT36_9PEZI|nr:glycoside hydrolase family 61 protein [Hypoxylon rubiginosum]
MIVLKSVIAISLAVTSAAHQNLHQFWVNGVSPGYEIGIRRAPDNNPVTDLKSNDIVCNVGGDKAIRSLWRGISRHSGPITHFLYGPVDDASNASGVGAGWFKIDEQNYVDGLWANEVVENAGGNYTLKLPTGLKSGDYLLRSEMLALHLSQVAGGAQFYMGCMQLKITGTGGTCSPTISLPRAYDAEEKSIYIPDFYWGFDPTTYSAPGGSVASCKP